jgi:hypothetical protein
MTNWTQEELGSFSFDQTGWCRTFDFPAFEAFRYGGPRKPNEDSGSSEVDLTFEADDEGDFPSEAEIAVARQVIANHELLLAEGIQLLFNDLLGIGPDSGMWWRGGIGQVREIIANYGSYTFESLDDLGRLLGQPRIFIQEFGYGYDSPCAIINFEAVFEQEHGIGMLTDGKRILGIGYQTDASPFEDNS